MLHKKQKSNNNKKSTQYITPVSNEGKTKHIAQKSTQQYRTPLSNEGKAKYIAQMFFNVQMFYYDIMLV